jgi:DNA polymerase-1
MLRLDDAINAAAIATPQEPIRVQQIPGLTVHVDGDALAYSAAGNEERDPGEARVAAHDKLAMFKSRVGAENVVVHTTHQASQKGERYLIATVKPYQGNRVGGTKPKNHGYLQNYLQTYEGGDFRAKLWTTREADDGIGACSHFAAQSELGYCAIAADDKDMRMMPGLHVSWRQPQFVTRVPPGGYDIRGEDGKQYGLKFFFLQMLMGDTADNCPGLELYQTHNAKGEKVWSKCGEKTAEKLLDDCRTVQEACARTIGLYIRGYFGSPLEDALDRWCEQAGLMWMRLGNDAAVADFAHHDGLSRINHCFDNAMWAAVERLETRVKIAREQISSLGCSDDPLAADCSSKG